ncbi:helix-turn-helix transcriptional regulator [Nitratireductor pacificus]|uniref:XRE family transcriptional regulator n=1 Tax=Nitratireductor pacificus pht-3B TaxID=391937 RepID=K2LSH9_9HYPH|nr:helix-turn-helix transcriptional regulator [Nitratireductor pacificus]EKF20679.1 XRE family transcriptional regulator [Nitratireductor pacificus pht-3B]
MGFEQELELIERDPALRLARARAKAARQIAGLLTGMRKDAGLTQAEVAARIGVTQARISQVESGLIDHAPSVDFAFVYAAACDRTIELSAVPLEDGFAFAAQEKIPAPAKAAAAQKSAS